MMQHRKDAGGYPMPFDGSKELIDIRANIKKYVQDELIPLEKRENLTPETRFPKSLLQSIWKRSRELGFYGIHLPEDLGGKNLSLVELCLLKEDLALTDSVLFLHVLGEMGGPLRVGHIFQFATPEQKEAFFLPVIRGEKACCFALTEKNAGSDATRIETRAVKKGDDYILNGRKHYITASPFADFAIVMAVTDPDQGAQGITAFLVDADTPGYQIEEVDIPMSGQHIEGDIVLTDCKVPAVNILGQEGQGFLLGMGRINVNRLLHCPTMVGMAQKLINLSVKYAQTREQFGGPIAQFQAIQHMLADMATDIYACRSMTLATAAKADRGEDIRMEAAMCKLMVSETAFKVADKAVQIHGATGLTKGHPVEWSFRVLRMFRILTGTSEIQKNTIARVLMK
jgi:alkylation response protein AidB-like acyl-CoA dehydrogenase